MTPPPLNMNISCVVLLQVVNPLCSAESHLSGNQPLMQLKGEFNPKKL